MSFVETFSNCCLLFSFEVCFIFILFLFPFPALSRTTSFAIPFRALSIIIDRLIAHHFAVSSGAVLAQLYHTLLLVSCLSDFTDNFLLSSHFSNDFILVNKQISFFLFAICISVCFLVFLELISVSRLKSFFYKKIEIILPIFFVLFCFWVLFEFSEICCRSRIDHIARISCVLVLYFWICLVGLA
jgi:hypothetical protein